MKKAPVYVRKLQVLDPPFRTRYHLWMATISYIFTVCLLIYCLVGRQLKLEKRSIFGLFGVDLGSIGAAKTRKKVILGSQNVNFGSIGSQIPKNDSFGALRRLEGSFQGLRLEVSQIPTPDTAISRPHFWHPHHIPTVSMTIWSVLCRPSKPCQIPISFMRQSA